jgi:hypothetical protein
VRAVRTAVFLAVTLVLLIAAGSASAVDLSARSPYLPPPDGMGDHQATLLAAEGHELILAVEPSARATTILRAHHARDLHRGFWLVSGSEAQQAVRRLERIGALRYAHENGVLQPATTTVSQGDPSDPAPWWLPKIGADRAAAPATPGFPITVIDSGIDASHPEFAARPVTYLNANAAVPPSEFHGTMVSSVAAAPANGVGMVGVYPNANLRSYDMTSPSCAETLLALDTAMTAGPSVINMSWGFSPPGCFALYDRLIQAFGTGSLPVAAAGNSRQQGSPPGVPAIWPHVLTVGATTVADTVTAFSNRDIGLDLSAPGEGITLATPTFYNPSGYSAESGTSFSAPMVSAAASWIATQRPGQHITQLFDLLRLSVRDVAPQGWDADTGFGILDLPTGLTRPLPPVDPQEPNDDINQVKAGGLFRQASPPLTRPGRGRAALVARLDYTEDPFDVYRVYAPGRRVVRFRVTMDADVNLELFRPNARTIFYRNRRAALRGALIGGSYKRGKAADTFAVVNGGRRGDYIYALVYKTNQGFLDANYRLTVQTRKK